MDIFTIEDKHTSGIYAKRNIAIVRGQGALLYDQKGREYIDCVAGQGVANIGHSHPDIVAAITEQASNLITCPEMFYNNQRAELIYKMASISPPSLERVFLCNSGTEAVEAALKFARLSTNRHKIVAAMRAFHGRTFGALSATWRKQFRQPFEPLVPGFEHIPFNNLERLDQAVSTDTAGVILEVVQGEGGVYPGDSEFLLGAQEICRQRGALLILDEVQTGFGRTGRMFAFEHYGLEPDLVCLAKSLAGGLPIGAVLIGERVRQLQPGSHGSTFGGNPLVCAASIAALNVLEKEDLVRQAAENGEYLMTQLNQIDSPLIREVRGMGLIVGIEIKAKVAPYLNELMESGILALPAGLTVIRLLPPLVITRTQLDYVISNIQRVLEDVLHE